MIIRAICGTNVPVHFIFRPAGLLGVGVGRIIQTSSDCVFRLQEIPSAL